jgi:hypothetical protein
MAESLEHYIRTVERLVLEQRVLDELKKELKAPVPVVRRSVKARALSSLPRRGGLNKWAAAIQFKAVQQVRGTTIRIHLTGGRNSSGGRSDIKRLDQGKARHPAWGRRGRGQWSVTAVQPGFFTQPASDPKPWIEAADVALDRALEVIR